MPPRIPGSRPRSGFAANRSFPLSSCFLIFSFRRHTCPKGPQHYRPPYWLCSRRFVPAVRFFLIVLRHRRFNDTDPRPAISACPEIAVHRCRLLLNPPSTWFWRMLACAYFSRITISPACPTTCTPNRGQIVQYFRCIRIPFWDLSPPLPAASSRSGCRTVVILFLLLRVCFPSPCHHRFRSPPFVQATEP